MKALIDKIPDAVLLLKVEKLALKVLQEIANDPLKPATVTTVVTVADPKETLVFSPLTLALLEFLRRTLEPKGYAVLAQWTNPEPEPTGLVTRYQEVTAKQRPTPPPKKLV